jgi:hypothetical protein
LSPENPRVALAREALRLHQRYQRELIERFSICPWAKPARSDDRVRAHVVLDPACDPEDLRTIIDGWAADEGAEVAFIIAPRFDLDAGAFCTWTEGVGALRADAFLSAPFHPNPPEPMGTIHLLRQTPDPTVQLVRRARLEEIRSQDPPHYTDIFDLDLGDLEASKGARTVAASVLAHNNRLVEREGRAAIQAIIEDIKEDRERTYARIS